MWSLFKRKPKSFLGIDIGTSSIKVVQLRRNDGQYKLETYGELQTYGYLERLNDPFQTKSLKMLETQVTTMLHRIIKEAEVNTKYIAISVPVFSSFIVVIDMPPMLRQELDRALVFEARQHIPISLSEVQIDWKIVGQTKVPSNGKNKKSLYKFRVLLVAVPKEVISRYIRIAQTLNLKLMALELESFSYIRSLMGDDLNSACILDIGARSTSFTIVDRGLIQASHSLDTAGTELTKSLSHGMGLSFARAEAYKTEKGLAAKTDPASKGTKDLLLVLIDKVILEVERTIEDYRQKTGRSVTKLILSGGSGSLPGLKEYVQEKLKIKVSIGDPWKKIEHPQSLTSSLKKIAPRFAVAVGLAMRQK